jgi:putative ribosome biogenesis GTPase RsgA
VRCAVDAGRISHERYGSYLKMLQTSGEKYR